ncbi:uncharacterized protein LOC116246662 isoform X3 [Nymphaea colorata]|uniref:uncharacterized protein LOC116246662 isoform X3 n=1 Tax=Nymphaea colorata TaxID=210225 RepID=UPI00214E1A14|nr:uncharacterized protein LOC116246662 isoform X3 [Nymphaea colorata]
MRTAQALMTSVSQATKNREESLQLLLRWHERLGHLPFGILRQLFPDLCSRIQESLKKEVIVEDDFAWIVAEREGKKSTCFGKNQLHYIGGVDLSFSKDDPSVACGALVVLDFNTMNVVYEDYNVSRLQNPYVPGFLAFRELLMVDGNGLLHPRGFGLACHLGVLADIPTIGIGKNLHHVDGLTESGVRQVLRSQNRSSDEVIMLTGNSGKIWGAAIRATSSSLKPIYVSIGHRISLETAVRIVKNCCIYRVPEPTRQVLADPGQQVDQMALLTSYWGGFGSLVVPARHGLVFLMSCFC